MNKDILSIRTTILNEKVIPAINDSARSLEEAMDILSAIRVPNDFYYYTKIKNAPQKISDIRDAMKKIEKWVYEKLIKFSSVEKKIIDEIVGKGNLSEYIAINKDKIDPELLEAIVQEVILKYCKIEADELRLNRVRYSLEAGLVVGDIEKATNFEKSRACCATYIAAVLYKSGALSAEQMNDYYYHGTRENQFIAMLDNAGWQRVSVEDVQPGDVCLWVGHVFIYAGDGYVWDQKAGVLKNDGTVPDGEPLELWENYKTQDLIIWRPCTNETTVTNLEESITDEVAINLSESTIETTVTDLGDNTFETTSIGLGESNIKTKIDNLDGTLFKKE